jgi:hypothetical protein
MNPIQDGFLSLPQALGDFSGCQQNFSHRDFYARLGGPGTEKYKPYNLFSRPPDGLFSAENRPVQSVLGRQTSHS